MKKVISTLTLFLTLCFGFEARSQQLVAGDIVFLAMQSDSADAFAFATLVNIESGSSIFFTDNGWSGTALFANENGLTWTANAFVPAGSVVRLTSEGPLVTGTNAFIEGPGTATGRLSGLSTSGEQILAYVGSSANPTFIAAISTRNFLAICNTTGAGNTSTTCLPQPLVLGLSAYAATNNTTDIDNIFFNLPTVSGSPSEIAQIVYNANNWTINNDALLGGATQWPNWQISVTGANEIFTNFTTSSVTLTEGGSASTVNIGFSPIANISGSVTININVNGGTGAAINFTTIPAHTNGVVTLPISSGSAQASFVIQANIDGIVEGTQSGSIEITGASPYLLGNPVQIPITINELPAGVSFISFSGLNENPTVLENAGAVNFEIIVSPAPTSIQQVTVEIVNGTGVNNQDFTLQGPVNGNVMNFTFQAGETSKLFTVVVIDDTELEGNETITFNLNNLSAGLVDGAITTTTLTIVDNDLPTPPTSSVFINEVASGNTNYPDEQGNLSDWIELFNAGLSPFDIAGHYISDIYTTLTKYQFPTGSAETVIPAGGYKIIWADNQLVSGVLHASFALSSLGEVVAFTSTNGTTILDSISFGPLSNTQSYGRQTNGSPIWIIFDAPTPNSANGVSSINSVSDVHLSVFPNPVNDWLTITLKNSKTLKNELITISNLNGQSILKQICNQEINTIDVSELPAGAYIINLQSGNQQKNGLFIKQ